VSEPPRAGWDTRQLHLPSTALERTGYFSTAIEATGGAWASGLGLPFQCIAAIPQSWSSLDALPFLKPDNADRWSLTQPDMVA
jgi:hypothetical protein